MKKNEEPNFSIKVETEAISYWTYRETGEKWKYVKDKKVKVTDEDIKKANQRLQFFYIFYAAMFTILFVFVPFYFLIT